MIDATIFVLGVLAASGSYLGVGVAVDWVFDSLRPPGSYEDGDRAAVIALWPFVIVAWALIELGIALHRAVSHRR